MSTGKFTGGGGVTWDMDLPLSEVYANQLLKGDLAPADDTAEDYLRELKGEPEPEPERVQVDVTSPGDEEPQTIEGPLVRPPEAGPGATRKAWAAYAQEQGVEVSDEDTRDDIIAKLEAA